MLGQIINYWKKILSTLNIRYQNIILSNLKDKYSKNINMTEYLSYFRYLSNRRQNGKNLNIPK